MNIWAAIIPQFRCVNWTLMQLRAIPGARAAAPVIGTNAIAILQPLLAKAPIPFWLQLLLWSWSNLPYRSCRNYRMHIFINRTHNILINILWFSKNCLVKEEQSKEESTWPISLGGEHKWACEGCYIVQINKVQTVAIFKYMYSVSIH